MNPVFYYIDLFCGAGGTTTGIVQAQHDGGQVAEVLACVNHDPKAIKSHWLNHKEVKHFEEDIRSLDLTELTKIVNKSRLQFPDAYIVLWASLECTNFSKAKGGQPRDADSRTLAEHLERYVVARQDKSPLYFVQADAGKLAVAIYEDDSEIMMKIKVFMSVYGLSDIKMRMLRVSELLKIQGFPDKYQLEGNQSDQKKFIGNSVVPQVVKCWVEAMAEKLIAHIKVKTA